MKAFLMYPDQDFDLQQPLPANEQALTQDLELNTLLNAMARGDKFLYNVDQKALLTGLYNPDSIRYRQNVLKDCLKNPSIVREIYQIPIESQDNKQKFWMGLYSSTPGGLLYGGLEMMRMFVGLLKRLKNIADEHAGEFESEGFRRFFAMIQKELDDEYFAIVQDHLKELRFNRGVLISAELGKGNEGIHYTLRKQGKQNLRQRIEALKSPTYTFYIDPRDIGGGRALEELREKGINQVASVMAQSADHIDNFLKMLRIELAFYIGCLNLYEQLTQMGEAVSFPQPVALDERRHAFQGLYDVCLALTMKQKIVGNDGNADNKDLVMITGANQGGKSTFLRSIGLAQLMMQCGMFTPADSFCANICSGLFTHYKRKEDPTMKSGKLDEELKRMSEIVDQITPNSMVLFNESFAATNEREGSEIARQITHALLDEGIKVFYVTHLYDLAHSFHAKKMDNAIFLRAERKAGGGRSYKLFEGEPLQTSYGEDLYHKVFTSGD